MATTPDDVAALPGAQDLARIAGQISSNAAAIRAIASSWEQAASGCEQQTGAVSRAAALGRQNWGGSAEQAFADSMSQFAAASSNEQECLRTGAKALNGAADALDEAQTAVEGINERLYTMLGVLRKQIELSGASSDFMSAATEMTAEAANEARGPAARAEQTLSQACATLDKVLSQMKGSQAFSSLYVPTKHGFAPPGSTEGIVAGNMRQNAKTIYNYLVNNGYSKYGAAGIVACIYGESTLNPEAVGSGGWGLIGFTPQYHGEYQDLYPTGNATADLIKQLPAILKYNDGWSQFKPMLNSATSVEQAADIYSQYFERPLILDSDVHAVGIAIAQQVSGL
jgi:uncharacterized protein YukE